MLTIVCYGDSNTWGYDPETGGRLGPEVRWPGVLRRRLPAGVLVVEEGLNGRTTIQDDPFEEGRNGLTYLWPCLATHDPVDLVVLALGVNDTKSFFPLDAAGIAAGAARLVETVQRSRRGPGATAPQVLLVAPAPLVAPPSPLQRVWGFSQEAVERSLQLPHFYAAVAKDRGCGLLDASRVLAVSPKDGVHLDPQGHEALGAAVAAKVRTMLGLPEASP